MARALLCVQKGENTIHTVLLAALKDGGKSSMGYSVNMIPNIYEVKINLNHYLFSKILHFTYKAFFFTWRCFVYTTPAFLN